MTKKKKKIKSRCTHINPNPKQTLQIETKINPKRRKHKLTGKWNNDINMINDIIVKKKKKVVI
jgi:hypothetical protein